ncbi:PP2C family protein-serine/threonine phosphatase [Nocardiopsis alkaliphila]|uniref:PP2C family protein-serine/threonine phosphatase n=1 Tax=Nocardiopsis alkaliphila TaxID=225762 RepID=UPI0012684691|nr:PP2C family protein-serine/threonine phosphatase [Nocardiopsis alkaliphila]
MSASIISESAPWERGGSKEEGSLRPTSGTNGSGRSSVEARLRHAAREVGNILQPERLVEQAVCSPVPEVADLCLLFLPEEGGAVRWTGAFTAEGDLRRIVTTEGVWPASTALDVNWLGELLDGARTVVEPKPDDPVEGLVTSMVGEGALPGALRAFAVPGLPRVAGALVVHRTSGSFATDIEALTEYAERVGTALSSARMYQYQARTAATLKAALVPEPLPVIEHALLGASFRSAVEAERIGGDFYQVNEVEEGFDFSFGDVCGKGNDAALLTGMIRQSLAALRLVEQDPQRLLELLNVLLLRTDPEKFSTMLLGTGLPLPGGGLRIRMAGGGHMPPLVVGVDGSVREVVVGGLFVGALEEAVFRTVEFTLEPGEVMVAYSDGVTEARNPLFGGQMLGEQRLSRLLGECGSMPAPAICDRIAQVVDDWLDGGEHDDITILAIQARPAGEGGTG